MAFDYQHPQYRASRTQAFKRSDGLCQFCGQYDATEAHHWRMQYKPESETTPDELTALCSLCHELATSMRRFKGNRFEFMAKTLKVLGDEYDGKPTVGIKLEQPKSMLPKRVSRNEADYYQIPKVETITSTKLPKRQRRESKE